MQGRQEIQPKLFCQVSLEDLVPANNYYRRLSASLDLGFLYGATAHCYGTEGQERGMAQANKHVMMAALTYNLRKYMNFNRNKVQSGVAALQKGLKSFKNSFKDPFLVLLSALNFYNGNRAGDIDKTPLTTTAQ